MLAFLSVHNCHAMLFFLSAYKIFFRMYGSTGAGTCWSTRPGVYSPGIIARAS